jgi:trimethylamine---corrinoid protein Co-methyltransferase
LLGIDPSLGEGEFHLLSEEQLHLIHRSSLEILQRVGYHVPVVEARDLLCNAGAAAKGERVFIPGELVEQALKTVRPARLYNRLGELALPLTPGNVTFGSMVDTLNIIDPYSRTQRNFTRDDQRLCATLLDALTNIDYVQVIGQSIDVPDPLQSQVAVAQTLRHTTKPILVYPYDRAGLMDIIDLVQAVTGSALAFREKPFLACASVPPGLLYGSDYNLELLLTSAAYEIPLLYYSTPALGANSPCSVAGTLVLMNADWLANLVIHQLKRPGAPFCAVGPTVQLMDMRTTLWSYCAPETLMAYGAAADLAHWYGLPAFGLEMISDTPAIDAQTGMEMFAQCLWAFLSGVEMVHNAGLLGSAKLYALEGNVLADEIIAYARAAVQEPSITSVEIEEAVSMIQEAGPNAEYVTHEHTYTHFRDFWYPKLFYRDRFVPGPGGFGTDLNERLNGRVRAILEQHQPEPLPREVAVEIEGLERSWQKRVLVC